MANQNGVGSTNVVFTFDANSSVTRTGTLTIANQTLTVTQAGATYVTANPIVTLVSSGLYYPFDVAVDGKGNVYIADTYNNAIKKWAVDSGNVTTLMAQLGRPFGVAVDGSGNVYVADTLNSAIKKWTATNSSLTTLTTNELFPEGVTVDGKGNVYFSKNWPPGAINKWSVTNGTVVTLIASNSITPLNSPHGVAVDGVGNVYVADANMEAIVKWTAVNSNVTTLVASSLNYPAGVAVDGMGNVYIADANNNAIRKWNAVNGMVTLVISGLNWPNGVAVDNAGNVYIADTFNNAIKELVHAFVDTTARVVSPVAGSDVLPAVLPTTVNLTGPFAPVSDSPWLTITGNTNGVVSFAFTSNPSGASRKANITLLGQTISVTQAAVMPPSLSAYIHLPTGAFQFAFTNTQSAPFTVLTSTNLSLPMSDWTVLGMPTNTGSGQYLFRDMSATNNGQRFYRVVSP